MAITLQRLCKNAESNYNMKQVAGFNGMENTVRWVHMVEDCEVPDFLHGNELIFTTGIGYTGNDWLLPFVKELKEHNAVGLVVNIGPHIDKIPPQVLVYCEENDFPLFTLPWEMHIIDITYEFCRRIINNEEQETTIANAMLHLIIGGERRTEYTEALEKVGFGKNSFYTLITVEADSVKSSAVKNGRPALWKILKHSKYHAAVFSKGKNLIAVRQNVTADELNRLVSDLNDFISTEKLSDVYVGISDKGEGFNAISDGYKQAEAALSVGRIQKQNVIKYDDIGIYKLLFGVEDKNILKNFFEKTLGELIKYDSTNDTDYVTTLRIYLQSDGSVMQTADTLKVHRNTINYKIKAIREILHITLCDKDKLNLMLAFCVADMLGERLV